MGLEALERNQGAFGRPGQVLHTGRRGTDGFMPAPYVEVYCGFIYGFRGPGAQRNPSDVHFVHLSG